MRKRLQCSFLILLFVVILSGCVETSVVDEVSMVRAAAFDTVEGGRIKVTANFPTFPEDGAENTLADGLLAATGDTTKGARIILNQKNQKPLVAGQLRLLLFSEELAEGGIENLIDAMYRDPSVGNRIYLAIAEGSDAGRFLESDEKSGELSGVFLPELIEHNMENNMVPETNMHQFLFSLYNDGRDAFLPLVRKTEEENIDVWGTAVFSGDKLHTKLDHDDSFMLKMMLERTKRSTKQFSLQNDEDETFVVIDNIHSSVSRTIHTQGEVPEFKVEIDIIGAIDDYSGDKNLDDETIIKEIETSVEETIKADSENLLNDFREKGIDPVGVGEVYRSTNRNWDAERWKNEIYPTVSFTVDVELKVVQSGAVEN
ncbi:Ger(x)C family spore germination protein [Halalkalibacter krulwichiae]|uniref:Spore germination protein A3 n=1 Tax=Halalkalibacter krulwichiae TaxID=199441 RepID=A0A1X9MCD3_9BACI|nr:Ger(x)C family spore germination protein [Halalkalibacter krulwichiae]ARK30260.1 hypothetical protein BkAM31D_10725 [Halalkalibacter krulwichiae]